MTTEQTLEQIRLERLRYLLGEGRPTWMYAIRARDRLKITTPQGQTLSGTVVMAGPYGWVINVGGKYGTPAIANETNIIRKAAR